MYRHPTFQSIGARVDPVARARARALLAKLISRIEKVTLQTPIQLTVKPRTSYFIQSGDTGQIERDNFCGEHNRGKWIPRKRSSASIPVN